MPVLGVAALGVEVGCPVVYAPRFMELQGKTGEVDADAVLGAYEDESSVSDWARTYVAWLVDQEVMGQNSGLEGNKVISRAEVAAMTVRLQPNGKLNGDEFLL